MNEDLGQEEQMLKDLEILEHQEIAIMGGTYAGELVKRIVENAKYPVFAYDFIYKLGRIQGIREERAKRASKRVDSNRLYTEEDYINLLRENERLKAGLIKARNELKEKVTV